MESAAPLEEKANAQAKRIIELEASVDVQIVLTEATYFAASAMAKGGANKELKELRAMMKKLTASITSQAETLAYLSTKTNSRDDGGGWKNTNQKKVRPGLHVCAHCKR